mmetsp:Transcript_52020/g.106015  ORF Transcript_52020/g.106015 Transcript_52020/m.106015 type:complete len:195 (+) Transcript_52020:247-831(+)|eukprot:CAMPEP_0181295566 /NCGR_PEP_ID=MMETSP1101-20121128/4218_1 /TAXON_ID=46948 /ORGANISM="Rhodomonas abbreviata, Strain Caron Lab Isolate" /LENGTH=194 /DNA_ID=CAMNT_0023400331 /DNA_START=236 /DNA_END=820 /DNA_ORIENTATION=+
MLCDTAVELVKELQRDSWLPPYNSGGVNQVVTETQELFASYFEKHEQVKNIDDEHRDYQDLMQLMTQHACLERNKRCVLAYLKHRAEEVMRLRWECGTSVMDKDLQERLSSEELELASNYDRMLGSYMQSIGDDIGIDMEPPRSTMVTVRVLVSQGEIAMSEGTVNLTRNSTHRLRRSDAQHLIRQGILEHVQS